MRCLRNTVVLITATLLAADAVAHHGGAHTETNISLLLAGLAVAVAAAAFMSRRRRS